MTSEPIDPRYGRLALQHLESLQRAGVRQLPRAKGPPKARTAEPAPAAQPGEDAPPPAGGPPDVAANITAQTGGDVRTGRKAAAKPRRGATDDDAVQAAAPVSPIIAGPIAEPVSDKRAQLDALRAESAHCTRCPVLVANRTQVVVGVGNPDARLTFFGEAPGADEDRLGEPFVGAAGKLLDKIIENGCGMRRQDVYICNTVCCRPPGNRNPEPVEIDNCRRFSERQLEIVHSPFICCLGAVAAQALLRTSLPVGKLRGTVHTYKWAKVIVTYHPAYLLRSPNQKRAAWEDIKLLLSEMNLPIPRGFA